MGIGSWAADQARERARWAVMSEGQKKAYLQRQNRLAALHEGEQIKQQYRAPVEEQRRLDAEKRDAERRAEAERRDAERGLDAQKREHGETEKLALGRPRTTYTGGVGREPLTVTHHKSPLPVAFLPPTGVEPRVIPAARHLVVMQPELAHDARFMEAARESDALFREVNARYGLFLSRLNNTAWWQELTDSVGVTQGTVSKEPWSGNYASGIRKVTTVLVPTITGVRVAADGLRVRVAHRPGDSAKSWAAKLDPLKAGFRAAGGDSGGLRITEDAEGNVVLRFSDADPFADAANMEAVFDADRGRSLLGVTETGAEAWITWNGSSGLVVGGVPGSGKTASMLPVFAAMAGAAELHVFDGKSGFDLEPLKPIARTYNRSGDIDAPLATLRRVEELRTTRAEALHASAGVNNFWNMPLADRKRLGMVPVFVILDEIQTWTDVGGMDKEEKATAAEITKLIRELIQKGRSAGIVTVLPTQKPDSTTIPTKVRDNAALKICFRVSTPEQAMTVLGGQAAGAPDPCTIPMKAKGRCVMEAEGAGAVLVQAGYATPEAITEQLADAAPVPDQLTVARGLLRGSVTPTQQPAMARTAGRLSPAAVREEALRLGLIDPSDTYTAPAETPATAPPAAVDEDAW